MWLYLAEGVNYLQRCLHGQVQVRTERLTGDRIHTHPLPFVVRVRILPSLTSASLVSLLFVQR